MGKTWKISKRIHFPTWNWKKTQKEKRKLRKKFNVEYKSYGYIATNCTNRKKKSKNKVMAAIWDDDSDTSDDESSWSEDDSSLGVRALKAVTTEPSDAI